jgi:hypothetical protein
VTAGTVRRPVSWGVAGLVGVAVLGAAVAAVPLGLTALGGVLVVAALRGAWDPTWNDGDGWFALAGSFALLVVLAGAAVAAAGVASAGGMRRSRAVPAVLAGVLVGAVVPLALLVLVGRVSV